MCGPASGGGASCLLLSFMAPTYPSGPLSFCESLQYASFFLPRAAPCAIPSAWSSLPNPLPRELLFTHGASAKTPFLINHTKLGCPVMCFVALCTFLSLGMSQCEVTFVGGCQFHPSLPLDSSILPSRDMCNLPVASLAFGGGPGSGQGSANVRNQLPLALTFPQETQRRGRGVCSQPGRPGAGRKADREQNVGPGTTGQLVLSHSGTESPAYQRDCWHRGAGGGGISGLGRGPGAREIARSRQPPTLPKYKAGLHGLQLEPPPRRHRPLAAQLQKGSPGPPFCTSLPSHPSAESHSLLPRPNF